MAKEYYEIADLKTSPFYNNSSIGRDVTLSTPSISIRNAAGIYVEPLDKERNYNMRTVKVFDPSGSLLFEMTLHAATHLETGDIDD
tara:strand:- start:123 stop:380 length:258 start_codon:yes stop_codon:yes gene_type:complete